LFALLAMAAVDDVADHSAQHRARDCAAEAAMRGSIADYSAADCANRCSRITAALTICRFGCCRRGAKGKHGQRKNLRISVLHRI
jgi:hypothetical protein